MSGSCTAGRILVVGGGITSAITTCKLAEKLQKCNICVWDKARGAGGRMATSRSSGNPQCKVDLGAQYISCSPENQLLNKDIYDDLISAELLRDLNPKEKILFQMISLEDGTKHYVTRHGVSSLVKHFFNRSKVCVDFGKCVTDVSVAGEQLSVTSKEGTQEQFDGMILTIPIPQVLDLKGDINQMILNNPTVHENLKKIEYSTRFAVGLFYDTSVDIPVEWTAKYISGHDIYRYVAIDNKKRGDLTGPTSVVAHTSVPFGIRNIEATPDSMKDMLVKSLLELFPTWPQPSSVKCLKWKFSQVSRSYPSSDGCLVLNEKPLVILAGDAFTKSGLDGCALSAKAAANSFLNNTSF